MEETLLSLLYRAEAQRDKLRKRGVYMSDTERGQLVVLLWLIRVLTGEEHEFENW